ncbi:hypothetical protein PMAYCL1PPCAC_14308, partial [Pristionchus mayeri]
MTSKSSLGVHLQHRTSICHIWSIDVDAELKLVNNQSSENSVIGKYKKTFNHKVANQGFSEFIKWDELVNEEQGYIKDDKIVVEARFTLSNIKGLRIIPDIDFTDPNEPRHDVALVIDGEKVYVSKQILAVHSPVFNAMFYGDFVEKDKKEIELKDIDRKEFIEMLKFIYPSYTKINDANAKSLLKLADRFQIKMIIDQVEQFLIASKKFKECEKLMLSDQFRLVNFQDYCLEQFETVEKIQDLQTTEGYKSLSNDAKATLLERVMNLRRPPA